jgi:hypothetical protein
MKRAVLEASNKINRSHSTTLVQGHNSQEKSGSCACKVLDSLIYYFDQLFPFQLLFFISTEGAITILSKQKNSKTKMMASY